MHKKNTFARRRLQGWVQRRDYFRRLFESMRVETLKDEATLEVAPVASSTERR